MNSYTDIAAQRRQGASSPLFQSDEPYDDKLISLLTDDDDNNAEIFEASLSFDTIGIIKNGWTGSCKSFNGFHSSDQSVDLQQQHQQLRLSIRQQKLQAEDYAKLLAEVDEDSDSSDATADEDDDDKDGSKDGGKDDDEFHVSDNVLASPLCPKHQAIGNKAAYELKRSLVTHPMEQPSNRKLNKAVTIVSEKCTKRTPANTTTTTTPLYSRAWIKSKPMKNSLSQSLHAPPVQRKTPRADELHNSLSEIPTLHRRNLTCKNKTNCRTELTESTASSAATRTTATASSFDVLSFSGCDPFESVSSLSICTMDSMIDICSPSPGNDTDSIASVSPMKCMQQPKRIACCLNTNKDSMIKKSNRISGEDAAPRAPVRKNSFIEAM